MYGGLLSLLSDYTMDIYIFHRITIVAARMVLWSVLHVNYYICSIMMFVFGILLPIMVSKFIIRKVPIFRLLLLGMKN